MTWDFRNIFTPNAPVSEATLLVGRTPQLQTVRDALHSRGAHPAVVGWRGVGKTSLVYHACGGRPYARINCSHDSTFDALATAALECAGIPVYANQPVGKMWMFDETETGRAVRLRGDRLTLRVFYEIVSSIPGPVTIVLDEYDRLPNRDDPKVLIGDLVKMLSDHADEHQCTLVFVGIATSLGTLLGAHQSIHRQIEEVWLPPLTNADIREFLTEAERMTAIRFEPSVRDELVQSSQGLPYVTHLLSKETVLVAASRADFQQTVTEVDFQLGKENAAKKVYAAHLGRFRKDLKLLSDHEKNTLRCVASVGYSPRDALNIARKLCLEHNLMSAEDFDNGMKSLVAKKLLYVGQKGPADVRFGDPLLGPFIRMRLGAFRTGKRKAQHELQMELPLFAGARGERRIPAGLTLGGEGDDELGVDADPRARPGDHARTVFISYSRDDERWLDKLRVHLKPLERVGLVDVWDDSRIRAGHDWRHEIAQAINRASVAVLLITAEFLASEFVATDELPPLLFAAEGGGLTVLPVIIGASQFEGTPSLARFQAVNSPSTPLNGMRRADWERVFVELGKRIQDIMTAHT